VVYAPSAFTPDADGINDTWLLMGEGWSKFELMVFDRWGEQIFFTDDKYAPWDGTYKGTLVQQEVYIYKAVIEDIFGETHKFTGHVTVIR